VKDFIVQVTRDKFTDFLAKAHSRVKKKMYRIENLKG